MGHTGLIRRQMTIANIQSSIEAKVSAIELELTKEKERRTAVIWMAGVISAIVTFSLPIISFLVSLVKKTHT